MLGGRSGSASQMVFNKQDVDISTRYSVGNQIGRGSFGTVYEATLKKHEELRYAVKQVPKNLADSEVDALEREIQLLNTLMHPHIFRAYEVFNTSTELMLVMELCDGGEFLADVLKLGRPLEEDAVAVLALDVLGALRYLHRVGICHRDLKPPNLLRDHGGRVKIADFGLSKIYRAAPTGKRKNGLRRAMKSTVGTAGYWAPEVVHGSTYDERCDIWSLGVIVYVALATKSPFDVAKHEFGVPAKPVTLKLPPKGLKWSTSACDFLQKVLTHDFKKRPSAKEALGLTFIASKVDSDYDKDHVLSDKTIKELLAFAEAAPLKRAMAVQSARHVNLFGMYEEMTRRRQEFERLDRERDGRIPVEQMVVELERSPLVPEGRARSVVDCLVRAARSDDEGIEYLAFMSPITLGNKSCMVSAFRALEGSDSATVGDLRNLVLLIDGEQAELLDQLREKDSESRIDLAEFLTLMGLDNEAVPPDALPDVSPAAVEDEDDAKTPMPDVIDVEVSAGACSRCILL